MSGSTGNWVTQSINGAQYDVLLPQNYNPSNSYSATLYLHQLDMGNDPSGLIQEVNPWFNTSDNQSIVVMPLLDQSADPSGQTINFGGVGSADTAGETNAIAALQQVISQYSVDTSRLYVTGNSMGGIGTDDMMIKYNAYNGTEGKVFAAGLSLSGADYGQGFPTPNDSTVQALVNAPFWTINGAQDTQVPPSFNQTLDAALVAAGDTKVIDTLDPNSGHDTWDQYYGEGYGPGTPLGWLDSQSTNRSQLAPAPSPMPSDNTGSASNDTTSAPAPTPSDNTASGSDTLTINAAGYAFDDVRPQFIVSVDGNQIGGVNSVDAVEYDGSDNGGNQPFTFAGNWGPGNHTVSISFLNNMVSSAGDDSNLFVNSISLDGATTQEYSLDGSLQNGFFWQNATNNFPITSGSTN